MIDIDLLISSLTKDLSSRKKSDREYYDEIHEEISELAEQVSYHAEFGKFPAKLFEKACPNQTNEEFEYNKETYRQKTKASWDKAVAATFRIWNTQNYTIEYPDQYVKDYFTYEYPVYGNFEKWFQDEVHPFKLADPNAVIAVLPLIPMVEEDGELKVDQTQEISPYCQIFDADDVWYYGEFAMLESEEKSKILVGGKEKKEGLIFYIFDEVNIYRATQVGKQDEYKFEYEVFYTHDWGYLPVFKLKGIPTEGIYHSYYMGAIPFLEDAILTDANFRAVKHRLAYPTRWYYTDKCNECSGHGYLEDYERGTKGKCHVCKGTGKRMTFSPFRDYEIPMPENLVGADTTQLPTPPFGSESPDTTSLEFLRGEFDKLIQDGFAAINIDITNTPNGQTATESKIDREEFFSFLTKFSSELFELMQNLYDAQTWMRYGNSDRMVVIKKPEEFTIRSAESITNEFSTAQAAKLPAAYLRQLLLESAKIRFAGDDVTLRIMELQEMIDPFITVTDQELNLKKTYGTVANWEVILHDRFYSLVKDEMTKDPEFLNKDVQEIRAALEASAKLKASELNTQRNAQDIVNNL